MKNPLKLTALFLASCLLANDLAAQRNLKDIPDSDPEVERKSFILADGFEVNLFAADPQIAKPIQMNFDERGRLWIAGSSVYPHIKPGQKADDKILILEDTDGDGVSDKTKVFASGMLIPTGVAPAPNGCYVANSTELIHLIDTDGDDKADLKKTILSGFGTEDTHHLLHTLRWGHDGCLYMNQSIYIHSHVETPYGVKRLNGGGIWRFRPETLKLEILCEGFVNPWGHHFDRWGQSFATDGAYGEGINYVFPGSVFVTAPGKSRILRGLNPGSPKHCGLEIIGGEHLPPEFQGNMITNDFRANRVCRFVVNENGTSGYSSRQEMELIKTRHIAFRPIDVKMGPDGAIYIADWYNPIIQHGEVDFRDPRRDHVHGRIWRLTYKGRAPLKHPDLKGATVSELMDHLKSPREWVRLHAKRLLKQQSPPAVRKQIVEWTNRLDPTDPQHGHHLLEALWSSQSIRFVNEKLLGSLLKHDDHRIRAAAIRTMVEWRDQLSDVNAYQVLTEATTDQHARVRLEAIRGLSGYPIAAAATAALKALDHPMDPFLDFALWKTLRQIKDAWLPQLANGQFDYNGKLNHLTFAMQSAGSPQIVKKLFDLAEVNSTNVQQKVEIYAIIAAQGDANDLGRIARIAIDLVGNDPKSATRVLSQLIQTSRQRNIKPAVIAKQVVELVAHDDSEISNLAVQAVGIWKLAAGFDAVAAAARKNNLTAVDSLALLGGAASRKQLLELLGSERPVEVRQRAINVLTLIDKNLAARKAAEILSAPPKNLQPALVIDFLLKTRGGIQPLIRELKKTSLETETAKQLVRAAQKSPSPNRELIETIRMVGKLNEARWKLTPELMTTLIAKTQKEGNPQNGQLIYRRPELQCQKCHSIAGAGGIVGPEMNSIGASAQLDYLIESLIDPNRKIKENYHSKIVQTIDGLQVSGVPIRENKKETVLRTAEGKIVTIPADDIEAKKEGRSLMPEGLVGNLTESELVDLISFLSKLGKVGEFAISKTQYARNWEALLWTADAHRRLNRTSFDSAASDEKVFQWRKEYTLVNGQLDFTHIPKFKIHANVDETSFLRTTIELDESGKVAIEFDDISGIGIWIDGKPKKIESKMVFELSKGKHRIVLAISRIKAKVVRLKLLPVESVSAKWSP